MASASWEGLSDPLQSPPKSEPTLSSLYDEVRVTVSQEAQIIQAVFPNPPVVMQVFLSRVFAQVVCSISCPFLLHEVSLFVILAQPILLLFAIVSIGRPIAT
jgi:hypothetical protein